MQPLAQPPRKDDRSFDDWMYRLWKRINSVSGIAWNMVSKVGSNLTDIETRNHADLQNINTASYTHLTATNATDLTDGGATTLHKHSHNGQDGLQGGTALEYYHLTSAQNSLIPSGVPTAGQVPIASSGTASAWGTLAAGGTVTSVSVVSANGLAGTVATATTTPEITLTTTITGMVKGNATAFSAATSGTDYSAGTSTLATGIIKSTTTTGALTIAVAADFPTLNQNTTGTSSNVTGTVAVANGGTGQTTAQLAINALSAVSAATNEHVLTKDTATGNAIFKVATGSSGSVSNLVSTPLTIAANTSFIVSSYLTVTSDLTVNGNLMVIG